MADKTLFITGATGNLGRELVRLFLEKTGDRLLLLVRPKSSDSHHSRIEKLLGKFGINGRSKNRIEVLAGDVAQPRLGLKQGDWDRAVRETDEFYHIAALTNLGAAWNEAEKINFQGTNFALDLARVMKEKGRLKRFFYFSTAYVAGSLTPTHALEDELIEKPAFANAYEETKYLAEKKVREESKRGLPVTVFRPSIVVGDSASGAVSEFNVIYPFMRLFAHGFLKKIPARLEHSFNIVPIDFVVRASFAIARQRESLGRAFHLVTENPPTLRMFLQMKEEVGNFPPVEVVDPEEFSMEDLDEHEKMIFSSLNPYLGYLGGSLTFDTKNTRQALRKTGLSFPDTNLAFLRKIAGYAVEKGYFLPNNF